MSMSNRAERGAEAVWANQCGKASTQAQLNLARASAVYENKTLITLESKSAFRFVEFCKLADR